MPTNVSRLLAAQATLERILRSGVALLFHVNLITYTVAIRLFLMKIGVISYCFPSHFHVKSFNVCFCLVTFHRATNLNKQASLLSLHQNMQLPSKSEVTHYL